MPPHALTGGNWNSTLGSFPSGSVEAAMPSLPFAGATWMDSGGIFLFLIIMVLGAAAILYIATDVKKYASVHKVYEWICDTAYFAVLGAGLVGAGAGIFIACSVIAATGSGFDPMIVVIGILIYAGLSLLGYCGTQVYGRIKRVREMYNKQNGQKTEEKKACKT